jgi:hypothetical protein
MTMERRWSDRSHVRLEAVVVAQGLPVERCWTRDIGLEGAFLDMQLPQFGKGVRVEVEFLVPRNGEVRRRRLPAVVMHRSEQGLGVMFLVFDQEAFRSIEELVYHAPVVPAPERRVH